MTFSNIFLESLFNHTNYELNNSARKYYLKISFKYNLLHKDIQKKRCLHNVKEMPISRAIYTEKK